MGEIKPLELQLMCCVNRKARCIEKMSRKRFGSDAQVFRYAIATGRAEFNPAADLSSALNVPNQIISRS